MVQTYINTGLRPVGSARRVVFGPGDARACADNAKAGDEISDELLNALHERGFGLLCERLAVRGLAWGEISRSDPHSDGPIAWLIYEAGKDAEAWEALKAESENTLGRQVTS